MDCIRNTQRGSKASARQRGYIEEALVALESSASGSAIDWDLLPGTWNVAYTTARDVRDIVQDNPLPFVKSTVVGQRFSSVEEGRVTNIITLEVVNAPILEGTSISIHVDADFVVASPKSIGLRFKSAAIGFVEPSESLQSIILSAMLPRGYWNLQVIAALRDFEIKYAFNSSSSSRIRPSLDITHLSQNLFVGRAQQGGGIYCYQRLTG